MTVRQEWRKWSQGQRSAALLILFFVGPLALVVAGVHLVPDNGSECGASGGPDYLSYVAVVAFLGAVAGSILAIGRRGIRIWIRLPVIGLYLLLDVFLGVGMLLSGSCRPMS
ncbi:MAG TPA: hypothetical protein VH459_07740 [Gaiellales bacterium]